MAVTNEMSSTSLSNRIRKSTGAGDGGEGIVEISNAFTTKYFDL